MSRPVPHTAARPRPLAFLIVVVAFFGGSCTMQQMVLGQQDAPSESEVSALFAPEDPTGPERERAESLARAAGTYLGEQARVSRRFSGFTGAIGFFVVATYAFLLVFGLRAAVLAPGAPRWLSLAAVAALPPRVALAAVEAATAKALEPHSQALFEAVLVASGSAVPAEQREAAGESFARLATAMPVILALAVCALLFFTWRYFQRPEVVACYPPSAPPRDPV